VQDATAVGVGDGVADVDETAEELAELKVGKGPRQRSHSGLSWHEVASRFAGISRGSAAGGRPPWRIGTSQQPPNLFSHRSSGCR
jgi:hypothetical protein